jgi:thioredoxin-like negative regulator of GroEL
MAARTPRMAQIETLLAAEPNDPELRYFLAMEYVSAGDEGAAAAKLHELTVDSDYVPAFLQAGQVFARLGKVEEACAALRKGIEHARRQGNAHALGEMEGLLASLE